MLSLKIVSLSVDLLNFLGLKPLSSGLISFATDKEEFFFVDDIYDFEKKQLIKRLTILLPGKGCGWHKKSGGCTMCGFPQKVRDIGKKLNGNDLTNLFKIAQSMTLSDKPELITIFNAGSFINSEEIDEKTQLRICRLVGKHPTAKKLYVESRAEYVTTEKIKKLLKNLKGKKLIVAIGLESANDTIRNTYIHKGLPKEIYEQAIKTIQESGARSLTYIFIKPVNVHEKDAIEDAVETVKYAFEKGSDEVALESAFVQPDTLMEKLYKNNQFRPPWLWSIIEVLKRTNHFRAIHLGKFDDTPPPIAIPENCPKCSPKIYELLDRYRETYDINLFNGLNCECVEKWRKELSDTENKRG